MDSFISYLVNQSDWNGSTSVKLNSHRPTLLALSLRAYCPKCNRATTYKKIIHCTPRGEQLTCSLCRKSVISITGFQLDIK